MISLYYDYLSFMLLERKRKPEGGKCQSPFLFNGSWNLFLKNILYSLSDTSLSLTNVFSYFWPNISAFSRSSSITFVAKYFIAMFCHVLEVGSIVNNLNLWSVTNTLFSSEWSHSFHSGVDSLQIIWSSSPRLDIFLVWAPKLDMSITQQSSSAEAILVIPMIPPPLLPVALSLFWMWSRSTWLNL